MILRRFKKHISEENWFAVSVDFLVVVVGIFVGLQVEGWNQDRKDQIDADRFLSRLYQDQLTTLIAIQEGLNELNENVGFNRSIINYIEGKTSEYPSNEAIQRGLCQWYVAPAIRIQKTVYDELVSTGRLGLITDEKLRFLLQDVHSEHERVKTDFTLMGDAVKDMALNLSPFIKWYALEGSDIKMGSAENSGTGCRIDLDGIAKSEDARSMVAQLYRSQLIFHGFRETQAEVVQSLIDYMDQAGVGSAEGATS